MPLSHFVCFTRAGVSPRGNKPPRLFRSLFSHDVKGLRILGASALEVQASPMGIIYEMSFGPAVSDFLWVRLAERSDRILSEFNDLLCNLLPQCNRVKRLMFASRRRMASCVRNMSPSATAAMTFFAADSIFSIACDKYTRVMAIGKRQPRARPSFRRSSAPAAQPTPWHKSQSPCRRSRP